MSPIRHSRSKIVLLVPPTITIFMSLASLFLSTLAFAEEPIAERRSFGILYSVWIKPEEKSATVKIRLSKHPESVRWMRLYIDSGRYSDFLTRGEISVEGDEVLWKPSQEDAWLQFEAALENKRPGGRYDGYVTKEWALLRLDDLVPPIRSDIEEMTQSQAKLQFMLPEGWSVATSYPRYRSGRFKVDDPDRLVDRPTGWLVMGKIGTMRERIGGSDVTVSAPVGQGVKRMDILSFFRWTVPSMQEIFPRFPKRLLVVSAGDPMWRGALSGPRSLFVHADRPLVSNNATSTFIHELVHVAMRARSGPQADWIVEGLAEYYSLEVLRRSGTISEARYEKAHAKLAKWGKDVTELEVDRSHGPITARAVGRLREIDRDIRSKSNGTRSLDDVVRALAADNNRVTRQRFEELVENASQTGSN
jgi:hypothetical protein